MDKTYLTHPDGVDITLRDYEKRHNCSLFCQLKGKHSNFGQGGTSQIGNCLKCTCSDSWQYAMPNVLLEKRIYQKDALPRIDKEISYDYQSGCIATLEDDATITRGTQKDVVKDLSDVKLKNFVRGFCDNCCFKDNKTGNSSATTIERNGNKVIIKCACMPQSSEVRYKVVSLGECGVPKPPPPPNNLCGVPCTINSDCAAAADGCIVCDPMSRTCTKVSNNLCGTPCVTNSSCAAAEDGCIVCDPTSKTCTKIPSCGTPCTTNAGCASASDDCIVCDPTSKTCTKAPACGTPCTTNAGCASASDDCIVCDPTAKTCTKAPPPPPPPPPPAPLYCPAPFVPGIITPGSSMPPLMMPNPYMPNPCMPQQQPCKSNDNSKQIIDMLSSLLMANNVQRTCNKCSIKINPGCRSKNVYSSIGCNKNNKIYYI